MGFAATRVKGAISDIAIEIASKTPKLLMLIPLPPAPNNK
jgi:hypothetical protein